MAAKKWIVRPGGRIVRWKRSEGQRRRPWLRGEPWRVRNALNRRERRLVRQALHRGRAHAHPHLHPHLLRSW
ncbi:MAG TPA: hypothetical protein VFQ45_06360 [Longimicrobium sp.]|nr:hypothetical protein [Longimicrobium sp.]